MMFLADETYCGYLFNMRAEEFLPIFMEDTFKISSIVILRRLWIILVTINKREVPEPLGLK